MSFARVFFLRAAGVVVIASAVATVALGARWGTSGTIAALGWAAACAVVLGGFGFRSLGRAMACKPSELLRVLAGGLLVRLLVLAVSQGAVFLVLGADWGRRTLVATVLLYLLVLGVEVLTLNQALRAGAWQRTAREAGGSSEGNAGE